MNILDSRKGKKIIRIKLNKTECEVKLFFLNKF